MKSVSAGEMPVEGYGSKLICLAVQGYLSFEFQSEWAYDKGTPSSSKLTAAVLLIYF